MNWSRKLFIVGVSAVGKKLVWQSTVRQKTYCLSFSFSFSLSTTLLLSPFFLSHFLFFPLFLFLPPSLSFSPFSFPSLSLSLPPYLPFSQIFSLSFLIPRISPLILSLYLSLSSSNYLYHSLSAPALSLSFSYLSLYLPFTFYISIFITFSSSPLFISLFLIMTCNLEDFIASIT